IGSGSADTEQCIELASRPARLRIWKKCKRLIIDEISMVDAELFDKLETVARCVRNDDRPFGGIQLILSGDFLQLPPVSKISEGKTKKFCFQADSWYKCISSTIELTQVYRQRDPLFISILQNIRVGSATFKTACQVMLVKNLNVAEGLVNGARGVVKNFESGNIANPIIKFACGIEKTITQEKWVVRTAGGAMITRQQLPLKLAWAVSIHKS
ncbi:hypothetical protein QZH41_015796, partial [Actinostola sp. cb2023]